MDVTQANQEQPTPKEETLQEKLRRTYNEVRVRQSRSGQALDEGNEEIEQADTIIAKAEANPENPDALTKAINELEQLRQKPVIPENIHYPDRE